MNKAILGILAFCAVNMPIHAVKFVFKGGASNIIDLAIFKREAAFETFIEVTTGSKNAARVIERYTKENSEALGKIAEGAAGAVAASKGVPSEALTYAASAGKEAGKLVLEGVGHLSILSAHLIKQKAKDYVNHYFEDLKPIRNNTVCRGFTGQRLIRHKTLIGADDLMDPKNPQDIFIAIFNRQEIKDDTGKVVIARPNDVIYAGPIKAADLGATFAVTTYILTKYETESDGKTRKKDASGNDKILDIALVADVKKVSDTGGQDCPQGTLTDIS